ncbi:hypothetical protein [Leptodesmis sichuanensis]|uniref:hypothetical protein n=1 Tax=Leptodesmis sichuanensis TaxID=2906798 RepID=UPI001F46EF67|nr:hypothetical protein [Leptodesmis sichuanensis]
MNIEMEGTGRFNWLQNVQGIIFGPVILGFLWLRAILGSLVVSLLLLTGCSTSPNSTDTIDLKLYQQWQLQPGDAIKGFSVVGSLGDIAIALNGQSVYAPFAGRVQKDRRNCLIFSSPDVPAYLFRLCGVQDVQLGSHNQGDRIGSASTIYIATLRKQPDGTWAIVEPSKPILERIVSKS